MVTAEQAARLGAWGVIASMQPNFDALWGGDDGMYAQRLGLDRGTELNPFALLASQGVPLAFGSDSPVTGMNPWATVRAATRHRTPGSAVSARAAFAAATRGAWRAGGVRDGVTGTLVPGAPASYAVWEADELRGQRAAPTRCSAGRPTRARGCPRCRDSARRPAAALPADGSSGCRHPWLGRAVGANGPAPTDDTDVPASMTTPNPAMKTTTTAPSPPSPTSRAAIRGSGKAIRSRPWWTGWPSWRAAIVGGRGAVH